MRTFLFFTIVIVATLYLFARMSGQAEYTTFVPIVYNNTGTLSEPPEIPLNTILVENKQIGTHHFGTFQNFSENNLWMFLKFKSNGTDYNIDLPFSLGKNYFLKPFETSCYTYYTTTITGDVQKEFYPEKYYTKNYFGNNVTIENVLLVDDSLIISIKNNETTLSKGFVTVSLFDDNGIWNCLINHTKIKIESGKTVDVVFNNIYADDGYHFIKSYKIHLRF